MNGAKPKNPGSADIPIALQEMLKGGLSILWRAFEYSRDLNCEPQEYAVGSDELFRAGWSPIDLRWLISRGYVELASRFDPTADQSHSIGHSCGSIEEKNARFILTESGMTFVFQVIADTSSSFPAAMPFEPETVKGNREAPSQLAVHPTLCKMSPKWDAERKVLRFCDYVVKQFRWAAANQEAILMAFEEEAWPARIDDPLPQKQEIDPKERLHDTIKCLNRNHKKRLIRFLGDGTGEGVRWEVLDDVKTDS